MKRAIAPLLGTLCGGSLALEAPVAATEADPAGRAELLAARHADVIVYGSTPGGFSAAIAAAREGASVILLEPTDHVGGLNTGGLSHCDSNQMVRNTVMGVFHEWHTRVVKGYTDCGLPKPYDPEVKDQAKWTFEPHVAMRVTSVAAAAGADGGVRAALHPPDSREPQPRGHGSSSTGCWGGIGPGPNSYRPAARGRAGTWSWRRWRPIDRSIRAARGDCTGKGNRVGPDNGRGRRRSTHTGAAALGGNGRTGGCDA
jgi:hypothetical protein